MKDKNSPLTSAGRTHLQQTPLDLEAPGWYAFSSFKVGHRLTASLPYLRRHGMAEKEPQCSRSLPQKMSAPSSVEYDTYCRIPSKRVLDFDLLPGHCPV